METVLTPQQMAAADRAAIESGMSEAELITRAGLAVAWRVRALLGGIYGRRAVVICGKGNNGADGAVAGEQLRRWGANVAIVALGELDDSSLDQLSRRLAATRSSSIAARSTASPFSRLSPKQTMLR